jgi:hypothetical protein
MTTLPNAPRRNIMSRRNAATRRATTIPSTDCTQEEETIEQDAEEFL